MKTNQPVLVTTTLKEIDIKDTMSPYNVACKDAYNINKMRFITNSVSQSGLNFDMDPSYGVFVSRRFDLSIEMIYTLTGTVPIVGQRLLQSEYVSLRDFPLNCGMNNVALLFNGASVRGGNLALYFRELMRYYNKNKIQLDFSGSPGSMDNCQSYSDLENTIKNPLAGYASMTDTWAGRNAQVEMLNVVNPASVAPGEVLTATFKIRLTEPLFTGVNTIDSRREPGFYGLNTIKLNLGFINDFATKSMSVSDSINAPTINTINNTFEEADISYYQYTPKQKIPQKVTTFYSYNDYIHNSVDYSTPIGINQSTVMNFNTMILSNMPTKIMVWVNDIDSDYDVTHTSSYFRIDNIKFQLGNNSGLLGNYTTHDLFQLSQKSGYSGSYQSFNASIQHNTNGALEEVIPMGAGSVLMIDGSDLGCEYIVGQNVKLNLRFEISVTNVNQKRNRTPRVHCLIINAGGMSIGADDRVNQFTSTLDTAQITKILSGATPEIRQEVLNTLSGGNFGQFMAKAGKGLLTVLGEVGKAALPTLIRGAILGMGDEGGAILNSTDYNTMKYGGAQVAGGRKNKKQSLADFKKMRYL